MIRRLLILGGGSDIAGAFVRRCAADDLSHVVLAGRPGSGSLRTASTELSRDLDDLSVVTADFDGADTTSHVQALASIDERHGPFDTVLIAFGRLGDPFSLDIGPEEATALAHLNYTGAVSSCLAALTILRGEPGARLIVVSSIAAVRPRVGNVVYGSAKAGLDAFALELAAPAKRVGIEVIVVRPGFVHSRMTEGVAPAPFATTPDEVAEHIVDGMTRGKAVIHCPPALGPVGFVLKNLPGPIWRRVSKR